MLVEIIFHTSSKPKVIEADDVYTKGGLLCVQLPPPRNVILKYPLMNVFQVSHPHGPHEGSTRTPVEV